MPCLSKKNVAFGDSDHGSIMMYKHMTKIGVNGTTILSNSLLINLS